VLIKAGRKSKKEKRRIVGNSVERKPFAIRNVILKLDK